MLSRFPTVFAQSSSPGYPFPSFPNCFPMPPSVLSTVPDTSRLLWPIAHGLFPHLDVLLLSPCVRTVPPCPAVVPLAALSTPELFLPHHAPPPKPALTWLSEHMVLDAPMDVQTCFSRVSVLFFPFMVIRLRSAHRSGISLFVHFGTLAALPLYLLLSSELHFPIV